MRSLAVVVVLGDVGRRPRMQYHALSLAEHFRRVVLLGYRGGEAMPEVRAHDRIEVVALPPPRSLPERASPAALLSTAAGRGADSARLLAALARTGKPELVLAQNPPAVPTHLLGVAARARGARFVIDWHNFSHAMLALKLGPLHPAVRALRAAEVGLGRTAHAHLCVSHALAAALGERFAIPAQVLYDRPWIQTSRPPGAQRRALLERLGIAPRAEADEPRLLVSPTSFSLDEDMRMLADAASVYRRARAERPGLPPICVLVTGRGPGRAEVEALFVARSTPDVQLRTGWLSAADYRSLLASADLGLCLHHSASGLDLPMKVADMFGGGLPVCMLDYGPVVGEQVRDGVDALLFRDADDLAAALARVLGGPRDRLESLRRSAQEAGASTWAQGWERAARPVLLAES